MMLYSAGEIVKKLHGVTTRQILDLAEKGLIKPARETTGAGSPRLYDFQNVFEICICLAVRGRIPAPAGTATQELTENILKVIREEMQAARKKPIELSDVRVVGFPPPPPPSFHTCGFDLLFISYDDRNKYSFMVVSNSQRLDEVLPTSKKYRPQNYCTYFLEVAALWSYLENIF